MEETELELTNVSLAFVWYVDEDSGLNIPSVVGEHLSNTNSAIGTGEAAARNIISG